MLLLGSILLTDVLTLSTMSQQAQGYVRDTEEEEEEEQEGERRKEKRQRHYLLNPSRAHSRINTFISVQ